jgi:Flp pilus assembly pilin Flp
MPNIKDETGQTSVEYALILALVAAVMALALFAVNTPFDGLATRIADALTAVTP